MVLFIHIVIFTVYGKLILNNLNNIVLYQNETESKTIEVLYDSEDFWLTQKTIAELFSVKINTINYHLKEIFNSCELEEDSVIQKILITANDEKNTTLAFTA